MQRSSLLRARLFSSALALFGLPFLAEAQEVPAHVVVVIEENHSYDEIIGNTTEAPYFNELAGMGAVFTNSHAIEHPSQPNYLDIFSGFNQGVVGDTISSTTPFTTANLGAELIAAGKTFAIYSETLPSVGYLEDSYTLDFRLNEYERKHNPASNWQSDSPTPANNQFPASVNQPFSAFPQGNFDSLPTVSFVIPNEQDDIHDGTITQGDNFLQANLSAYAQWAMTHNSLLVITFDENDDEDGDNDAPELASNQIPTFILGQNVIPGNYNELSLNTNPQLGLTHYNLLQTLQDFYGTAHAGVTGLADGTANPAILPITDIFSATAPVGGAEFSAASYTVNESAGTVAITVQRLGSSTGPMSVRFETKPGLGAGSAKPGANFENKTGTLTWPAGDTAPKTFDVKIVNRGKTGNSTRSFYIDLFPASPGLHVGKRDVARVTIKENAAAPVATPTPTPAPLPTATP